MSDDICSERSDREAVASGASTSSKGSARLSDQLLRIQRRKPAREIFEFADIARPAIFLQPIKRRAFQPFGRQPLVDGNLEEMTNEIADVISPFAQRRQTQRDDIEAEEQIFPE